MDDSYRYWTSKGNGSAATYISSLLYMNKSVIESGMPRTEQANAMVSILWLASECLGCFIGATIISAAFVKKGPF